VPLTSPTTSAPALPRFRYIAAFAATLAIGGAVLVLADDSPTPRAVEPSQIATTRQADIRATKAANMRAIGRELEQQPASPVSRHADIRAAKTANMRAIGRKLEQQRATPASRYENTEAMKARLHRR
jgi:hypothetical protein